MEKITIIKMFTARNFNVKFFLTIACLICSSWHIGFYEGCSLLNHFIYSFFHANGFHLTINLLVLWQIKGRIRLIESLVIATLASFLPTFTNESTMGLSGFLFSAFGLMWGETGRWKDAVRTAMPFIFFTMLLSNVNGILHLYTFLIGFFIGYLHNRFYHTF